MKTSFQASVRAPNQRHDELVPISSLPSELITEIILLASAKRDDVGLAWLNVAHVCRQWREIVLNLPLFWSHINVTYLTSAGAAEMLARAKEVPLHLEGMVTDINYIRYSAFNKELQAHLSHIRHLDIIAAIETWGILSASTTLLQNTLVASPAPILEYLSLSNYDVRGTLSIPDHVFKGKTPRLSFLQLHHIDISWKSSLLRDLRYLKIFGLGNNNRPRVRDWLDALDDMPQLKELVLHDASPLANGLTFPFDIKRTATLPVLTHLDIFSTAGECALALAHLVLPALTSLIIEASSDIIGYDALMLIQFLPQHAHGPQDAKPLQSVLFHSDSSCTRIVAWPTVMPDICSVAHCQQAERTARVVLSITCETFSTSTSVRILDAVIEALPLDGLVALTAEHQATLDEYIWLRHARRWPLLEHVQLSSKAAHGLTEILLQEDNGGHESPLLPLLRQLDLLEDNSLTKRRTLRLCDALKRRVEQGFPLKVLGLRKCKWTIDAVRLIRGFVADVRGPNDQTSWQEALPPGWDPETCDFVNSDDNSDEEVEIYDPDEVEEDDEYEDEEEEVEGDDEVEEDDDDEEA